MRGAEPFTTTRSVEPQDEQAGGIAATTSAAAVFDPAGRPGPRAADFFRVVGFFDPREGFAGVRLRVGFFRAADFFRVVGLDVKLADALTMGSPFLGGGFGSSLLVQGGDAYG